MGKKKRAQVFVLKPWCWYCEREFEDEKVLLQHQKSKHFKCQQCPRKLNTAGGLMVHSQQVHKCEPEPLTNTLPGRDGYDIEIFGMEGVPTNALAEWKAGKEAEFGASGLANGGGGGPPGVKRPRHAYTVIPEADLMAALAQHKILMAARNNPRPAAPVPYPGFPTMPPPSFPPFAPPPTLPPFAPPGFAVPPGGFPPMPGTSPFPPPVATPLAPSTPGPAAVLPKDGVLWPDNDVTPAEKRAQQARYRYTSPTPDDSRKRKAAADFL